MSDPFERYETLARGGDPTPPPAPPVENRPTTMKIDGITISSDRLAELDRIARQTAAARAVHADALADLRSRREDLRQRAGHLRSRIAQDPRLHGAAANLAELDAEIATLTARMSEAEAELAEAASAAAVARANLKTALSFAREHGLAVPPGVHQEGRA
jgi:chromosome segregation ATPase